MSMIAGTDHDAGIAGSNIFLAKQAPRYPVGFGTGIGICACAVVAAYVLRVAYQKENKRRDEMFKGQTDAEIRARYTDQELLDLGDKSPFFRYTL